MTAECVIKRFIQYQFQGRRLLLEAIQGIFEFPPSAQGGLGVAALFD
jgi:hypothetical protein